MPTSAPHPNVAVLTKLFTALGQKDHATMASCYHADAVFRDIAFYLEGREKIHGMWRMICHGDIEVKFVVAEADDYKGRVKLIDSYTFHSLEDPDGPGCRVVNAIESRFLFQGREILRQDDYCDARDWARQAIDNKLIAFLAGRLRLLRSRKATAKLERFLKPKSREQGVAEPPSTANAGAA